MYRQQLKNGRKIPPAVSINTESGNKWVQGTLQLCERLRPWRKGELSASDKSRCLAAGLTVVHELERVPRNGDDVIGLQLAALNLFIIDHSTVGATEILNMNVLVTFKEFIWLN